MAKATLKPAVTEIVPAVVKVIEPAEVTLTLTLPEAEALLAVCNRIGGSPKFSRRGLFIDNANSIGSVLSVQGVTWNTDDMEETHRSIYFVDKFCA